MATKKQSFLEVMQEAMPVLGFWQEEDKETALAALESTYSKEVTENWGISDISVIGKKILIKWYKKPDWWPKK